MSVIECIQGPDITQKYTDQLQKVAAQISETAEPTAQTFIDEQLQPNAQYIANRLEPEVTLNPFSSLAQLAYPGM